MSDIVWVAIIGAIPVLLGLIGRGVAWLVKLIQDQADKTITALKEENSSLRDRLETCENAKGAPS
jgi:hypothetical protein